MSGSGRSASPRCLRQQQQYGLSGGADISEQWSQPSNVCLQRSTIPRGKIMLWRSLFYPPLPKGNMLTLLLWKWSWKIFEACPWSRCGTPCLTSWWPFAQLVICARDCHVLSKQGLPFAIRCYKWRVLNQAFFCGCCPYDRGKYPPVMYLLIFCM